MDNMQWIKELVHTELTLQEKDSGEVSVQQEYGNTSSLQLDTTDFLNSIKARFVAACSAFNQLKGTTEGRIKIYSISKTEADFMIFRNGYKIIFSMQEPGRVSITMNHTDATALPGENKASQPINQDILIAKWQAFGRLIWTHKEQEVDIDHLVRFFLSRFIQISLPKR